MCFEQGNDPPWRKWRWKQKKNHWGRSVAVVLSDSFFSISHAQFTIHNNNSEVTKNEQARKLQGWQNKRGKRKNECANRKRKRKLQIKTFLMFFKWTKECNYQITTATTTKIIWIYFQRKRAIGVNWSRTIFSRSTIPNYLRNIRE